MKEIYFSPEEAEVDLCNECTGVGYIYWTSPKVNPPYLSQEGNEKCRCRHCGGTGFVKGEFNYKK